MGGGREGRIYSCTRTVSGCLSCSAAPQATPPGYSPRGNSNRGNALWVPQGNRATGCREEGRVVEERRRHVQATPTLGILARQCHRSQSSTGSRAGIVGQLKAMSPPPPP